MKVSISHIETLEYQDYPLLFVGRDAVGAFYLCFAAEETNGIPQYIAIAISREKLEALKFGEIDLRSAFAQPELGTWFRLTSFDENQAIAEPIMDLDALPDEILPSPGEYLSIRPKLKPDVFAALKINAVAEEAGMNPTLLRQYISGAKRPSIEQLLRVQEALHRVGKRLVDLRLV